MRIWQGKLRVLGPTIRAADGGPHGKEVQVRVALASDDADPVIDVADGVDGTGVTRWREGRANEFYPASILRALAMTSPEQ